jgi:hypothetical protein
MKAISIMGIVILHAIFIQYGTDNVLSTVLRLVVIKTLLFLSGFVVYGKVNRKGWVLEKVVRRLPLLFIFTGIYFVLASYVAGIDGGTKVSGNIFNWYIYNITIGFNGLVIWYVWTLILCYVLLWLFEKYVSTKLLKIPYLVKLFILSFSVIWIPYDYFGFAFLRWYGMFMFLGYGIRYAIENYSRFKIIASKLVYSTLILFPLVVYLIGDTLTFKGEWASSTGFINILNAVRVGEAKYIWIFLLIALLGIGFTYCVSRFIAGTKLIRPFLLVGSSTIGILLMHKIFLEVKLFDNYWIGAIISLSASLGLYLLLKRVKILNYVLFGGTDIPITLSKKLGGWYEKVQA